MLQQDLDADQHENRAAGNARLLAEARAKPRAQRHAGNGEHERRRPDDQHGRDDRNLQKGERDAHRQGVDARGKRKQQKRHQPRAAALCGFLLAAQRFHDHLAADEQQQRKHDPVIQLRDILLELAAKQIADQRHQRLKAPKEQAHQRRPGQVQPPHVQALAKGRGKRIRRQTDAGQQQFHKGHLVPHPRRTGAQS